MTLVSKKIWSLGLISLSFLSSSLSYSVSKGSMDTSTWGMYQGNAAHTGFVPINIDITGIKQLWTVDVGEQCDEGYCPMIHPATIGKQYVFVSRGSTLQAFSLRDGHVAWSKNFKGISLMQQPNAYADGKVFVQTMESDNDLLRSYDEVSGEFIWGSPFKSQKQSYNAPVIDNNVIYACSGHMSGLTAYDLNLGAQLWSVTFREFSYNATSAVNNKYALYYNAGVLIKLNKKTGEKISEVQDDYWEWSGSEDATPVLFGEKFAFVTSNNYLAKFNLAEDKIDFRLSNVSSNPSVDNQNIYVIKDRHLTAINTDTGEIVWSVNDKISYLVKDILVTENLVFISTKYETKAYSKTNNHEVVWKAEIGGKLSLSSKGLFIISPIGQGTLTAFSIQ